MARTHDQNRLAVGGLRWRRTDPAVPARVLARLNSPGARGRSGVRIAANDAEPDATRHRTQLARVRLGERRTPWREQSGSERRERWNSASADPDALDDSGRRDQER